jgi:hypothetical protein
MHTAILLFVLHDRLSDDRLEPGRHFFGSGTDRLGIALWSAAKPKELA